MKKLVMSGFISGLFFLMFFNVSVNLDQNTKLDNNLIMVGKISFANSEEALCLGNYIFEANKKFVPEKKCWREKEGPDLFEGFVYNCEDGGTGCQPTFCSDQSGCYTTDV